MKNLGSKTLETERLILRAQTMDEQKYLWSVLMNPDVNRYYLTVPKKFAEKLKDWDKQEEYYKEDMKHANDPDVFKWSVFIKDTGECIGRVSCHKASDEGYETDNPSIRGVGWYIDPKYKGHGYGYEAAQAMMDYMFNECEIDEIKTGAAIQDIDSLKDGMTGMLSMMKTMLVMIIAIAVLLGGIIIYNLGILSYSEKQYQFSTLKVLGFNDNQIKKIFIKQNNWVAIISIIIGLPLGFYLTDWLFKTAIEENYDFGAFIENKTYIISALGTFIVSYLVSRILSRKINKIDMVTSLKGNE